MGYYLVSAVMGDPPDGIGHRDLLVLIYMAHIARDYPYKTRSYTVPASIYAGGWDWIALIPLRRPKYDQAAERAVARNVRKLRDTGAIEPVLNPIPGAHQRAYLLNYTAPVKDKKL